LHALEAMIGHKVATPLEVSKYLKETWPAGEDTTRQQGGQYSKAGNYSILALQRILYWFWCRRACRGTQSLELQVVSGHAEVATGTPKEEILGLLNGADAFMINSDSHYKVVRKAAHQNNLTTQWYLVDSLHQSAHPDQVKIMGEADWQNLHGTFLVVKRCTAVRMLETCEFTEDDLTLHQQRLAHEEAGMAPTRTTDQGKETKGAKQVPLPGLPPKAPAGIRNKASSGQKITKASNNPTKAAKVASANPPKTAQGTQHQSCGMPDISKYFLNAAQSHLQDQQSPRHLLQQCMPRMMKITHCLPMRHSTQIHPPPIRLPTLR
jgi:hypothetical protein